MEHIVYLDNSSTTKPCVKAIEYINKALTEDWGNPSSLHMLGINAEMSVTQARKAVARSVNSREDEIFFTSGGTEANNTAIMSVCKKRKRGGRIITTAIEHPSVLETVKRLENEGFETIQITPDSNGVVSLSALKSALNTDTVLVSMMLVNNEIGTIQPIAEAVQLVKSIAPSALFHCDAVQAYGKMPVNVRNLGIDMLTASAHKIHGPKGIGFIYIKKGINIPAFITGGGQESGLRSGTESVPLICGLCGAAEELPDIRRQTEKQNELIKYARARLSVIPDIVFNSPENALPYILNISLMGYRSETLLHFLEQKDIYVSSGSACAKGEGSYVLKAIGLEKSRVDSALRISFSRYNTAEDIDMLYDALCCAVKKLRKAKI